MEIGSIYEINPEMVSREGMTGQVLSLKEIEKYGKKNTAFTASGRSAIGLALRSFVENRPEVEKKCLLPAYMCDTVFFPFEWEGWEIYFYHINKNLEADAEELQRLIGQVRPGLLFIHPYYGVDTWKPMRPLLHEWKNQGICIMEDVTQSYYLKDAGEAADYVVGSLRKWYPVPDGGFVASNERLAAETAVPEREFIERRLDMLTAKWDYLYGDGEPEKKKAKKAAYLKENRELEAWLDGHKEIGCLSGESAYILDRAEEEACRRRRVSNCRYLQEMLKGKSKEKNQFWPVLPGNGELPITEPGALPAERAEDAPAPLYFPVYVRNREELQYFLVVHDIYAPVLWPVGEENRNCLAEDEEYIFSHILALPMDQRYGEAEMERMVQVLEEYERRKSSLEKTGEDMV